MNTLYKYLEHSVENAVITIHGKCIEATFHLGAEGQTTVEQELRKYGIRTLTAVMVYESKTLISIKAWAED